MSKKEKSLVYELNKYEVIIVYGAGLVGHLLVKRLLANQLGPKLAAIAVSKREGNEADEFLQVPIREIDSLIDYRKNAIILIATLPNLHKEIKDKLIKLNFQHILPISQKMYIHLSSQYIKDFKKNNSVKMCGQNQMRVLMMSSDNNKTSGAFLCMAEMCEQLKKEQVDILIVLPYYGLGEELLKKKKLSYTYVPSKDWAFEIKNNRNILKKIVFLVNSLLNVQAYMELRQIIRLNKIEIVHCNSTYTYIGALCGRNNNISIVWHLREDMREQGNNMFMEKYARNFIAKSDKTIAISHYINKKLKMDEMDNAVVIYDAVDTEKFYRNHKLFADANINLAMIGAINEQKGQRELVEALAMLPVEYLRKIKLQIWGKGKKEDEKKLEAKIAQMKLDKTIYICGESSQVQEVYRNTDIVIVCGKGEGFGRVTVEAQLSGCLVIGADSGATPELVEDNVTGFLYESGNAKSLAECICKAIDRPSQAVDIAQNGQVYAKQTYSKGQNAREILKVYHDILGDDKKQ